MFDSAYADRQDGAARYSNVRSPTSHELTRLTQIIARRVGRLLERQGLLERDADDCMDVARCGVPEVEQRKEQLLSLWVYGRP